MIDSRIRTLHAKSAAIRGTRCDVHAGRHGFAGTIAACAVLLVAGHGFAQDAGIPDTAEAIDIDTPSEVVAEGDVPEATVDADAVRETPAIEAAPTAEEAPSFEDGIGFDEVPWAPHDDVHVMHPAGTNFGLELRIAGGFGQYNMPVFELGGIFDHRYVDAAPWHFRVVVAFSYQVHVVDNLGGGTTYATNPLGLRLRLFPIAVDLGSYFSIHVSADVGVALTPRYGVDTWSATFLWGALAELCLRLIEGRLEIGVSGGIQMSTLATTTRTGAYDAFFHQGIVGGRVGWLFE